MLNIELERQTSDIRLVVAGESSIEYYLSWKKCSMPSIQRSSYNAQLITDKRYESAGANSSIHKVGEFPAAVYPPDASAVAIVV